MKNREPEQGHGEALPSVSVTGAEALPDLNQGLGGSYIRDPKTGARTLTQRTAECSDCNLTKGKE